MKRSGASGQTVETHFDFGLGATGPRLLAPPGLFEALARTGPTMEKWLMEVRAGSRHLEALGKILRPPTTPNLCIYTAFHFKICIFFTNVHINQTLLLLLLLLCCNLFSNLFTVPEYHFSK